MSKRRVSWQIILLYFAFVFVGMIVALTLAQLTGLGSYAAGLAGFAGGAAGAAGSILLLRPNSKETHRIVEMSSLRTGDLHFWTIKSFDKEE